MTDATRAHIVRLWLLAFAVTLAWLLWPGTHWLYLAPGVLGFFMCCCEEGCECANCNPAADTCDFQIDISGVSNNTCMTCSNLDGAYIVGPADLIAFLPDCRWQLVETECTYVSFDFRVNDIGSGNYVVNVSFNTSGGSFWSWGKLYLGAKPNCASFSSESMSPPGAATGPCSGVGSTCTVTHI
jgi:hypothetical protein